jgi:hypothetical protein
MTLKPSKVFFFEIDSGEVLSNSANWINKIYNPTLYKNPNLTHKIGTFLSNKTTNKKTLETIAVNAFNFPNGSIKFIGGFTNSALLPTNTSIQTQIVSTLGAYAFKTGYVVIQSLTDKKRKVSIYFV